MPFTKKSRTLTGLNAKEEEIYQGNFFIKLRNVACVLKVEDIGVLLFLFLNSRALYTF